MSFPRADIHQLLTCDLLHQVIKGAFKDHLVQWVEDYLKAMHGLSKGDAILDEIDRRYVKLIICLVVLERSIVLHLRLSFLGSGGLNKAATSNSGPATIQRLL